MAGGVSRPETRWVPPHIFHPILDPESQQSCQARCGRGPITACGFHTGPAYCSSQGQMTGDINGYFCLLPAASIFAA